MTEQEAQQPVVDAINAARLTEVERTAIWRGLNQLVGFYRQVVKERDQVVDNDFLQETEAVPPSPSLPSQSERQEGQ